MEKTCETKIGIVGGGIQGLSLAYFLSQKGFEVTVFEKESYLGGLAGCFKTKGDYLEKYYHHIFTNDKAFLSLTKELGLGNKLISKKTLTSIFHDNKIYPFSSPFHILKFNPLSVWDRVRFGLSTLLIRKIKNWRKLAPIPASKWLKKYAGKNAYQKVWEPLLKGKFGPYADRISMAWFWSRVVVRGTSRSKGEHEELIYLKGGLDQMYEAMRQRIEGAGGKVLYPLEVKKVKRENDGSFEVRASNKTYHFDKVVLTTAAPIVEKITVDLPKEFLNSLGNIRYQGAIVAVLSLKKSLLKDVYWLNINDPEFPFIAVVEQTNYIPKENYGGEILVYIGTYSATTNPLFTMENKEIVKKFTEPLDRINPKFDLSWIKRSWVFKDPYAQAVVNTKYSEYVPNYKTPIEDLYLVTHSQIYPWDRGMNQAVIQSKNVADLIVKISED